MNNFTDFNLRLRLLEGVVLTKITQDSEGFYLYTDNFQKFKLGRYSTQDKELQFLKFNGEKEALLNSPILSVKMVYPYYPEEDKPADENWLTAFVFTTQEGTFKLLASTERIVLEGSDFCLFDMIPTGLEESCTFEKHRFYATDLTGPYYKIYDHPDELIAIDASRRFVQDPYVLQAIRRLIKKDRVKNTFSKKNDPSLAFRFLNAYNNAVNSSENPPIFKELFHEVILSLENQLNNEQP